MIIPRRFLFIALCAFMLGSNSVYAHNDEAQGFLSRGEIKLRAGQHKEAIKDFTRAIELEPKLAPADLATAYFNRGSARRITGDSAGWRADFLNVIELDPTPRDAAAYCHRGIAKDALGNSTGATEDLKTAAALGDITAIKLLDNKGISNIPNADAAEAKSFLSRGENNLRSGHNREAMEDFTRAIELEHALSKTDLSTAYFNRGNARRLTGDNKGFIEDFKKAVNLDPTPRDAMAYFYRGSAKSVIGDRRGAIADYTRAIELDPGYSDAYTRRGKVKELLGNKKGAQEDFKKAAKLDAKSSKKNV